MIGRDFDKAWLTFDGFTYCQPCAANRVLEGFRLEGARPDHGDLCVRCRKPCRRERPRPTERSHVFDYLTPAIFIGVGALVGATSATPDIGRACLIALAMFAGVGAIQLAHLCLRGHPK